MAKASKIRAKLVLTALLTLSGLISFELAGRSARALPANDTADVVFGQNGSFETSNCDSPPSASSLCLLAGSGDVAVDSAGNVYVADWGNLRVLGFNTPLTTDTVADRVFGQGGDFTSTTCNFEGVTANSLCNPGGISVDSQNNLWVVDAGNNRVLKYNNPVANDTTADAVLGQGGSFTTNACAGVSASTLCFTDTDGDVLVDPAGNVYVAERHRILQFDSPLTTNQVADRVFGQSGSFLTANCNQPGITAGSLCTPSGLALDASGNMYVADAFNNRVLRYLSPLTTNTVADAVFGQGGSFSTSGCNSGAVGAASLCLASVPQRTATVALNAQGNLFVADRQNSRVLEYDSPLSDTVADRVYGKRGVITETFCNFPVLDATSLCAPSSVAVDPSGLLYVVDSGNNRALAYLEPLKPAVPADEVFGQNGDFGSDTCMPISASSLCMTFVFGDVAVDSAGNVYISDADRNRVLQYNTPLTTDLVADRVFGQQGSFTSDTCNIGGGASASGLCFPHGLAVDGAGNLYVADTGNSRVLVFNTPLTTDTVADFVFGQSDDLTGFQCNQAGAVSAATLCMTAALGGDVDVDAAGNVYIADTSNHRVLRFNTPLTTDRTADHVFGQAGSLTSSSCNPSGVQASSLCWPSGVAVDTGGNVYVADSANHRALMFNVPMTTDTIADAVFGQGGSFLQSGCNNPVISAVSLCLLDLNQNSSGSIDVDSAGNVYITDGFNHRLLEYDTPATTDTVADRVYGQVSHDYGTDRCNNGGVSRASLCEPHGLGFGPDRSLYVVDNTNNRMLVFVAGADVDGDGCSDVEEFGLDKVQGGLRDPDNEWDFYDVNESGKVDSVDVAIVRANFNGVGPTPPEDRIYDRSSGAAPWAPGPPDNKINLIDVNLVRAAFNHSCQLPP